MKILINPQQGIEEQSFLFRLTVKLQPELSSCILGYFLTNMFTNMFMLPWWTCFLGSGIYLYVTYVILSRAYFGTFILLPWHFLRFPTMWIICSDKLDDEIQEWCRDHCKGSWISIDKDPFRTVYFNRKSDVAMFMLFD